MATVSELRIEGGDVALDFVNTVEALHSYAELVQWCLRVELLSPQQARELLREAQRHPRVAQRTFDHALERRALLYEIFCALADGGSPAEDALGRLQEAERDALGHGALELHGGHVRWGWRDEGELAAPLWRVTHAAVELLAHGRLDQLEVRAVQKERFRDRRRSRRESAG